MVEDLIQKINKAVRKKRVKITKGKVGENRYQVGQRMCRKEKRN